MTTVLLSAGDASGDDHAAELVTALRARRPGLRARGLAGPSMRGAGVEAVADTAALAVGGPFEWLASAAGIARAWRRMGSALEEPRPDLLVLVDSSGFNLPLARRARRAGIATLYYVAPQLWAWRRGRLRRMARSVDRVAALWPFEARLYQEAGIRVDWVGHPLVDRTARIGPRPEARRALGLAPEATWLALMPGSRRNELAANLPLFLKVARELHAADPRLCFAIGSAPTLGAAAVEAGIRAARLPESLPLRVVAGRSLDLIAASDAVLAKPGTVTLEAALLGRPLVVAARTHPLSAALLRRLVAVDCLAMPNLLAGTAIVPELLQERAQPAAIARELRDRLEGPERERQLRAFAALRPTLGEAGASERVAGIAEEMLGAGRST